MTWTLRAEWTKLRTVPSTLWTLLIAVVTALGGSVILALASATDPKAPFDPVTGTFIAWGEYPVLAIGVLGALAVTNEYSTGQIRTTFTAVPAVVCLPLVLLALPWSWGDSVGSFGLLAAAYQLVSPDQQANLLPEWAAVVTLLAWPALALLVGGVLIQRRDV